MLIRCKSTTLSDDHVAALGGSIHPQLYDVTELTTYLVLGLTFYIASRVNGSGVYVEMEDDFGLLVSVPLFLFDIIDGRPSQYWVSRFREGGSFALWPPSFFGECHRDRLSEGVADVRRNYEIVRAQLREEADMWGDARPNSAAVTVP